MQNYVDARRWPGKGCSASSRVPARLVSVIADGEARRQSRGSSSPTFFHCDVPFTTLTAAKRAAAPRLTSIAKSTVVGSFSCSSRSPSHETCVQCLGLHGISVRCLDTSASSYCMVSGTYDCRRHAPEGDKFFLQRRGPAVDGDGDADSSSGIHHARSFSFANGVLPVSGPGRSANARTGRTLSSTRSTRS